MDAPRIVITEHLDQEAIDWLSQRAHVTQLPLENSCFDEALQGANAIVVRTYTQVDEALLDKAPNLRVVGRAGVGLDNIDLGACQRRGVEVVHTPDANTQAVVEYVTSILCDQFRPLHPMVEGVNSSGWAELRNAAMASRQLSQCRLGVLGFGRIGSRVAQVGQAIGMQVAWCDVRDIDPDKTVGMQPLPMEQLLESSDVLSVHVDGRCENHHLIDAVALERLPDDALLVNTSRGFVIDPAALAHLLRQRPKMRAVLDVHDPEPVAPGSDLLKCPNAILLPHAASRTLAAQEAMSWVVRDVAFALGLDLSG
ncbi:MAG: hypothetical protein MK101_05640 [Phycisphaerales bacterium]|nr:hypothetical protein [Phycisphaerales bacterium]